MEEFTAGRFQLESYPSELNIPATTQCNLRCIGCSIHTTQTSIDITNEGFQRLFDAFPYATQVTIAGAEMFFDRDNSGYVQKIFTEGQQYPHLKFSGLTNGTLITEERAEFIVEKFSALYISLDSIEPEIFAHIRKGANLHQVIRNIRRIRDLKRLAGKTPTDFPRLRLNFIITEYSYMTLLGILDLATELEAYNIQFQAPWPGTFNAQNIFHNRHKTKTYFDMLTNVKKIARERNIIIEDRTLNTVFSRIPSLKKHLDGDLHQQYLLGKQTNSCSLPYTTLDFNFNGDAAFCCTAYPVLGNINTQTILEIWNSPKAQAMRKRLYSGRYYRDCKKSCVAGYVFPPRAIDEQVYRIFRILSIQIRKLLTRLKTTQ